MKNGLSPSTKWWIALVALIALAMGITGAASATRASTAVVDADTFANTLLLDDNLNTMSLLQATATPAVQQTPAATPAAQQTPAATQAPTGGTGQGTGQAAADVDIVNLPNGYFQFHGYMGARDTSGLIVSNQKFEMGSGYEEDEGLLRGERVIVTGIVRGDGKMVANNVQRVSAEDQSNPFLFTGVVSSMDGEMWVISGTRVKVSEGLSANTNIREGSRVSVSGNSTRGGAWIADSIALLPRGDNQDNRNNFFIFSGMVNGNNPYNIAGRSVNINEEILAEGQTIRQGDMVSVQGTVSGDNWRATQVQTMGRISSSLFIVGVIEDTDPITVRGLEFNSNDATLTTNQNFKEGTRVQILATGRPGGVWTIVRMGGINYQAEARGNLAQLAGLEGPVTICHNPGGTAGNAYPISVSLKNARMHILEHNDTVGACE